MKKLSIIDLRHDKSLLSAVILLSALSVVSILFYVQVVYTTPLNVSGSASPSTVGGFSPAVIGMIVFSVFVLSMTVSVFLRELRRHFRGSSLEEGASLTDQTSMVPSSEELETFLKKTKEMDQPTAPTTSS